MARLLQGWLDLPLTARGREQAGRVATALVGLGPIDGLYTSPLRRAAATAAEIGRRLGVAPVPEPDLRECDVGDATGLTWDEFARRFPEWAARIAASQDADDLWPNGESTAEFRGRCQRAMARIVARHPEGAVVVVAHGGSLAWALAYLLEPGSTRWPTHDIPTASITEVLVGDGPPRLLRLGDLAHLA